MQFEYGGGITEEEKKKKKLGIGGAIDVSAPVRLDPLPERSAANTAGRGAPFSLASRADVDRNVDLAQKAKAKEAGKPQSALVDYFKMAQLLGGEDKANKRIKDVGFLWKTYMGDMDGSKAIAGLAFSPYSTEVIEGMLSAGHTSIFDYGNGKEPIVPAQYVTKLGLDINKEQDVHKAALVYGIAGGNAVGVTNSRSWTSKVGSWFIDANKGIPGVLKSAVIPKLAGEYTEKDWDDYVIRHYGGMGTPGKSPGQVSAQGDAKTLISKNGLPSWESGKAQQMMYETSVGEKMVSNTAIAATATVATAGLAAPLVAPIVASPLAAGALAATGGKIGAGIATIFGLGALKPWLGSEATARSKAETAAAAYLLDPLNMTHTDVTAYDEYGNAMPIRVTGADEANALRSFVHTQSSGNSADIQRAIQQDTYDSAGNIVRWGVGRDLEVTGTWDGDWDRALDDWTADQKRAAIEDQMMLIRIGALNASHPIDGNMDDPDVIEAIGRLQIMYAEQEAADLNPSIQGKVLQSTGLPLTKNALDMWWNQITSYGVLQGLFHLPIDAAHAAGGLFSGTMAVFNYGARAGNDIALKAKEEALKEYLRGKGFLVSDALSVEHAVVGDYADDPEAQRLYAEVKQRKAQLLNQGWGDDTMGTVGNLVGVDSESVARFSADHPEAVIAANFGRDIFLGLAGARVASVYSAKSIAPNAASFHESNAAYVRVSQIIQNLKKGDLRGAIHMVGGKDAKALVQELVNTRDGKWSKSQGIKETSHLIREDLLAGNKGAVQRLTALDAETATALEAKISKAVSMVEEAQAVTKQENVIARILGKQQAVSKNVFNFENYARETSAKFYGPDARAVFPDFRAKNMAAPSQTKVRLEQIIANTEDPAMKWFFGRTWKFFERAPLSELDYYATGATDRVFEAGLAASNGDFGYAMNVANKWAQANTSRQFESIMGGIVKRSNGEFNLSRGYNEGKRPTAVNVDPLTGEKLFPEAVSQTTRLSYKVRFGPVRDSMMGTYNTKQMEGIEKVVTQVLWNPGREARQFISKRFTNPLRKLNVGMSPTLAVKHFFADRLFRQLLQGGVSSVFRAKRWSKKYYDVLGGLNPENSAEALASLHKFKMGEQMYNVGRGSVPYDFKAKTIYEANPKTGKMEPVNLDAGVDDIRRWLTDAGFVSYTTAGRDGLRTWLYTKTGRRFMRESNNMAYTKATVNEALELKGSALYDAAVEDYIARVAGQMYEPFEGAFPRIFGGMKEIVTGKRPLNDKSIRSVIEEANAGGAGAENPYLSIGGEPSVNMVNPMNWVGTWMRPNKTAREQFYKTTFVRTYEKLQKEGVEANAAARIATDVAELQTTRVMFDLSNALYIEGQNRWFAYFATKHRLYGTHLGKMAIERPWVADAALQMAKWMEVRNEQKDIEEWDKHKLVLDMPWMPGPWKEAKINLAGIYWLSDYPLESSFGKGAEEIAAGGLGLIPRAPNIDVNWGNFGASFARFDRLVLTAAAVVPLWEMYAKGEMTEESLKKYFDELPGKSFGSVPYGSTAIQQRLQKMVSLQMLYAEMKGEPITVVEATSKALWSGLAFELVAAVKPLPLVMVRGEDVKVREMEKTFWGMSPGERSEWMNQPENKWFSGAMGLKSANPATRQAIDAGWATYTDIRTRWAVALENALDDGSLMNSDTMNSIMTGFEKEIDALINPEYKDENGENPNFNRAFSESFLGSDTDKMLKEEAFKILLPLVDPRIPIKEGYAPTEEQANEYKAGLQAAFDAHRKEAGLLPSDNGDPAYFWAYQDAVQIPYEKYAKIDPSQWMTYRQQTAADVLAQGEGGPNAAAKYAANIHNQVNLKMLGRGIKGNSTTGVDASAPVMALMTTQDKKLVGWNSTILTERYWRIWAQAKADTDRWVASQEKGTSSAVADAARERLAAFGEQLSGEDPGFKKEWDFSHLPLEKRLRQLGVGSGKDAAAPAWYEFLNLVDDYKKELANTYVSAKKIGVSPQAQAAAPVAKKYLRKLVSLRLKERNPTWWYEFDGLFPLSSFGFFKQWSYETDGTLIAPDYKWATKEDTEPAEDLTPTFGE